jgi:hypothetical protein
LCKNFILQALFQSAQHLNENREGSGSGSGSPTLPPIEYFKVKICKNFAQHCFYQTGEEGADEGAEQDDEISRVNPLPLGSEFIRDLRIKALDLSVFVRKSALQVQYTRSPWGQSSIGT